MSAPGSHIPGWMNEPELLWLHETAKVMDSIVEVGSLHGRSSYALLTGCPGPVYCIDPWSTEGSFASFLTHVGHFENLHEIKGYSPQDAPDDLHADMVFLDGDHDYGSVYVDLEFWTPRARRLICGHDYSEVDGFPGVKQAVDDYFNGEARQAVLPGLAREDSPVWEMWL